MRKYFFYCHRMPSRSFISRGKQFPLCARCTGIVLGYAVGIVYIHFIRKRIPINNMAIWESLLMIPTAVDGIGQYYRRWENNNTRRFLTGILAGVFLIYILRIPCLLGAKHGDYLKSILFKGR